jgi:hypothetical protein
MEISYRPRLQFRYTRVQSKVRVIIIHNATAIGHVYETINPSRRSAHACVVERMII